jgi:hypothetical protein
VTISAAFCCDQCMGTPALSTAMSDRSSRKFKVGGERVNQNCSSLGTSRDAYCCAGMVVDAPVVLIVSAVGADFLKYESPLRMRPQNVMTA